MLFFLIEGDSFYKKSKVTSAETLPDHEGHLQWLVHIPPCDGSHNSSLQGRPGGQCGWAVTAAGSLQMFPSLGLSHDFIVEAFKIIYEYYL